MNLRNPRTRGILGLLVLAVAVAGCGTSNPSAPMMNAVAQQNADDATQQVAMTMAQGNGGAPPAATTPAVGAAAMGRVAPSMQAAVAETTFTTGHVTWTLTRTWFDAGNVEMLSFNPVTTVRMFATSRGVGTIETPSDTASIGTAGTLDVRGISVAQDTLVTNASRSDTVQAVFTPPLRGGRVHLYTEGTGAWSEVRNVKPVNANPWPLSGTATWTLHVSRLRSSSRGDVSSTFDETVVVTFNGTRYPDVSVTGGFHYTIDLMTGGISRR